MVNETIDGLSVILSNLFEDVTIYSESIPQGFKEPCFFILNLTSEEQALLGNRALRITSFNIQYFPKDQFSPKAECQRVAETLYGVLRNVEMLNGIIINGTNLNHEIVDNVLHFQVTFKSTINYPKYENESMGNLEIKSII